MIKNPSKMSSTKKLKDTRLKKEVEKDFINNVVVYSSNDKMSEFLMK